MKPKKQNKQKDILFILISSFILVILWIGFNLYHIWATSTVSQDVQMQLTPIAPNFDPSTIQQLKTRENINPSFERAQQSSQSAQTLQPTPPVLTPIGASSSGALQLSPSPSETVSQTPSPSVTTQQSPSTGPILRQGQ